MPSSKLYPEQQFMWWIKTQWLETCRFHLKREIFWDYWEEMIMIKEDGPGFSTEEHKNKLTGNERKNIKFFGGALIMEKYSMYFSGYEEI